MKRINFCKRYTTVLCNISTTERITDGLGRVTLSYVIYFFQEIFDSFNFPLSNKNKKNKEN